MKKLKKITLAKTVVDQSKILKKEDMKLIVGGYSEGTAGFRCRCYDMGGEWTSSYTNPMDIYNDIISHCGEPSGECTAV